MRTMIFPLVLLMSTYSLNLWAQAEVAQAEVQFNIAYSNTLKSADNKEELEKSFLSNYGILEKKLDDFLQAEAEAEAKADEQHKLPVRNSKAADLVMKYESLKLLADLAKDKVNKKNCDYVLSRFDHEFGSHKQSGQEVKRKIDNLCKKSL